jgi:beta-glucanase (GH16 family)
MCPDANFHLGDDEMPHNLRNADDLLWSEEFTIHQNGHPNGEVWNFELGDGSANGIPGWGNQELEYYRPENATVVDGMLQIVAERNQNADFQAYYGTTAEWTSARMQTLGKVAFRFGSLEFRAKLPSGDGTWPALWLLGTDIAQVGWPQCGEIDLAEVRGDLPDVLFNTVHGPGYAGDKGVGVKESMGVNLDEEFHTYRLDWLPDRITWRMDGRETYSLTADQVPGEWVFNKPHFVIMNLAIGGNFTGPVDPNLERVEMLVDYIRYYKHEGFGELHIA